MPAKRLKTVVIVDDSEIDIELHTRAIKRSEMAETILSFPMAEDAMAYMRTPGAIPADLVLLDINMPCMDGFEMLDASIEEFGEAFLPSNVVMLSTSSNAQDIERANTFSVVKDFFEKPLTADKFTSLVTRLTEDQAA